MQLSLLIDGVEIKRNKISDLTIQAIKNEVELGAQVCGDDRNKTHIS